MNKRIALALLLLFGILSVRAQAEASLRIFIRAGVKTHGPGQHDHPRFLKEWVEILNQRGAKATGAMGFPTAGQLADTDVLVLFAADAGDIPTAQREYLDQFLKRGGGIVVIHDAVCGKDAPWFKTVVGGAWDYSHAKYFEGDLSFYYQDHSDPITRGASNFDFTDEMYYDLDMMPEVHVLAACYKPDARNKQDGRLMPSIYDIIPQMWTYEKDKYRAFVCIPGHNYSTFELPHFRAVLLRGIAWAGHRDADLLVSKEELASLMYPEGGPTAPKKAAAKISVPPEFTLNLVAAEPLIDKPISMDWDPKGRLWIAETPEYPFHHDDSTPPRDRISILEDPDSQGRMRKKTVFYEGLNLVTSMVFYRDGVIVSQAPDIIWLRDTKGTGKADTRTVLYTGFGTRDTHAVVSNLRWGLDGWIYATVGYSAGDLYSGDGKKHFGPIASGVLRFKPDGSAVEQVSSKGGNTWGVDIGPDNEVFFSQANGNHINHVVMTEPELAAGREGKATSYLTIEDHTRSYPQMSWKKQAYVQIDWVGNFTAAAGCCIYDGGAWPEKYNYTHYVTEPTLNIVHQDEIQPKGATYVASRDAEFSDKEFMSSTDLWFRPIHTRVGPDGALYVLDFYNQAAVHNDTRGVRHDPKSNAAIRPDRDHYFGRIWRVQNKQAKKLPIPDLSKASQADLVQALSHANMWVRMTAQRLLVEKGGTRAESRLIAEAKNQKSSPYSRIAALWTLNDMSELSSTRQGREVLNVALADPDASVRKNALEMVSVAASLPVGTKPDLRASAMAGLNDPNPRIRLEALVALARCPVDVEVAKAIVGVYPSLKDQWLESAAIGVANEAPVAVISAAMDANPAPELNALVAQLGAEVASKEDGKAAAELVRMVSGKPFAADGLKIELLQSLTQKLRGNSTPEWTSELQQAFKTLLASSNPGIPPATLPLLARWDKSGAMADAVKGLVQSMISKFGEERQPDEQRLQIAQSLLAVRQLSPDILSKVASIPGGGTASLYLQRRIVEALGTLPDAEVGGLLVASYPKMARPLQEAALNELFKRADWCNKLLDAIKAGAINLSGLGPVAINRLRTNSDADVARRANAIIDELRGPEMKEKNALIAKFTPLVVQPGDAAKGKALFTQNCAICHKFNGEGKDIAPDLTGMGAHGPAELIVHVLDPNREVEPNYYSYSIDTTDGETYDGIIARENRNSLTLRSAGGDKEISVKEIKSRKNTGLSLMPNGFEALGGDGLRDIMSYLCAGESRYRLIDMRSAFTADTSKGLWIRPELTDDSLVFKKFGLLKVDGIPFEVLNPQKSPTGKNIAVLKGGDGASRTRPQKVEIENIGVKAARLHFLGGVGGWAYPFGGADRNKGMPVAKVTVHYEDNQSEEIILKNGQEFADWISAYDVPGSKSAAELVTHGQVRTFSKSLAHAGVIKGITLESYNNDVAPAFVAITADSEAGSGKEEAVSVSATASPAPWGPGIRVLAVGGNASHDFNRWFNMADSATLAAGDLASEHYTERVGDILPALSGLDVLFLCCNQPVNDPALRKGIFDFANSGHGLLLFHAALWRNWKDWPEYNRELVGGGATSHDRYGEFEVTLKQPDHPLLAGVPKSFRLSDELYHFEPDQDGTPMEVLAEGKNLATGKTWPVLWISKHPKARIVCCTLGHDAGSHDLDAYKTILRNSLKWAAGK